MRVQSARTVFATAPELWLLRRQCSVAGAVAVWRTAQLGGRRLFWVLEVVLGVHSIAEVDRRRVALQVPVNSRLGCSV